MGDEEELSYQLAVIDAAYEANLVETQHGQRLLKRKKNISKKKENKKKQPFKNESQF